MKKSIIEWNFVVALLLAGCVEDTMFVKLHLDGTMPEPTIQLERKLSVSSIEVYRVMPSYNREWQRDSYWILAAKNKENEIFVKKIRYGSVPEGFDVFVAAKVLEVGHYVVDINLSSHITGGGGFMVLKTKEDKLSVMNLDTPSGYKDTFFLCANDVSYLEDDVKSKCMSIEYLRH